MKTPSLVVVLVLVAALAPVFLALNQNVPAGSLFKQAVLLLSLAAFGLVLGQFWLSRLLSWRSVKIWPAKIIHWHKVIGSTAGGFLLIHPVLMVARRFWVQESGPGDNLLLMLRAPVLRPAIIAWVTLALLLALSIVRRSLRRQQWRILHGLLAKSVAGLTTWHVIAVGRHSNTAMSDFWAVLAAGAIGALLNSYRSAHSMKTEKVKKGVVHELAR